VPVELDALLHLMLAKAPADRIQTMSEVVRVLEALLATVRNPESTAKALTSAGFDGGSTGLWETQPLGLATPAPTVIPALMQGLSVLLIEPSRAQAAIIRKLLQDQGIQDVEPVTTGVDALQALRKRNRQVVVCAMHLTDATGLQLAERIRCEVASAPPAFVLISSEAESQEVGSLSRLGKAILLKKPFTSTQLGEALRVVAAQPPIQPQVRETRPEAEVMGTICVTPAKHRAALRVLIVDDSAAARIHMRNVLTGLGFSQLVEAPDGARAVALAAAERFDLIVTDYNMPLMDGAGLTAYLKQNPATASVPVIMVTTETNPAKLDAVRKLGAVLCEKSFAPETVRTVLERLVPPL
jgi:two-component system, chemotaxis family, chemotaxis protein CheY